jgi:AcrR family transcriptional regulator
MATNSAPSASGRSQRGDAVRNRLLDVAEKLFAERGLDAVSLNSIARCANQLNGSVMQYHFGSKAGLIEAILERRMEELNRRRNDLIANIDPSNRLTALRQVAEAMVLPFAEQMAAEGGSAYLRFTAQVTFNTDKSVFEMARGKHDTAVRKIAALVQDILHDVRPEVVRHRLALVTTLVLFGVGEREKLRMAGRHGGVARLHTDEFIRDLIQMIVGALNAPIAVDAIDS